uniref:Uncharacterized protein n=1 Tax=Arundo donax TaxID=35708 RepID=A0A0A9F2L5_ARUDO
MSVPLQLLTPAHNPATRGSFSSPPCAITSLSEELSLSKDSTQGGISVPLLLLSPLHAPDVQGSLWPEE